MNKQKEIIVFRTIENLAEHLFEILLGKTLNVPEGKYVSLALSGGSTPKRIFDYLSSHNAGSINWKKVKIFWCDERCVPPDDEESNYKMTRLSLLQNLNIPDENIFRIYGENEPEKEAIRYSQILRTNLISKNALPRFDIVLLGIGEDGHTASIFPGNSSLFQSVRFCEAVIHPQSGQQRITITGSVINNADSVIFIVTGASKAKMLYKLVNDSREKLLPASLVNPITGNLLWMIDTEVAKLLNQKS